MNDPSRSFGIDRFILLYALAWAGGSISYTPLLTILLPVQVAGLAGMGPGVKWLGTITLVGAIAASLGGILFGYISDLSRNRRGWIGAGLILSNVMLLVIGQCRTQPALIAAIVAWQLSLNMMLGPLAALAGDRVPDDHKGRLGGLMAFAPGMGALSGALITMPLLGYAGTRLELVALLVSLCITPVLLVPLPPRVEREPQHDASRTAAPRSGGFRLAKMWLSRLAVQIAEASLFSYLYFWLLSIDGRISDHQTARLFSAAMVLAAPLALAAGRWSDRTARPLVPLQACAGIAATGLFVMSLSRGIEIAIAGYLVFGLSSSVFLALHSAQTLRILPRPARRARDLGLFNLANTVPSLIMPWLAIGVVPVLGYAPLFAVLAALSLVSCLLLYSLAKELPQT
ncbi:MAG: MFS transporter [Novosphingobium sp.]